MINNTINKLIEFQKPNGEFKTYAIDCQGESFYIGESPFATAHILCLLYEVNDNRLELLKEKGLEFLESLDTSKLGLYKYWYKNTFGTAFANLPFDLDDTAMVNQVLSLYNRKTVDPDLLIRNVDEKGLLYTWWKPKPKFLFKHFFSNAKALFDHYKSYLVFVFKQNGHNMAEYNDSELIVRLNVYTLLEMLDTDYSLNEEKIPVEHNEVAEVVDESLHYMNEAMYYYALSTFVKYTDKVEVTFKKRLQETLGNLILEMQSKREDDFSSNVLLLLNSIHNLRKLNSSEIKVLEKFIIDENRKEEKIMICVGNKKFENYHQYYAPAFNYALMLRLSHYL